MADRERIKEVFFEVAQGLIGSEMFSTPRSFSLPTTEHLFLKPIQTPTINLHLQGIEAVTQPAVLLMSGVVSLRGLLLAVVLNERNENYLSDPFDDFHLSHGVASHVLVSDQDFNLEAVLTHLQTAHPYLFELYSA